MFDRLRKSFSNVAKTLTEKELNEDDIEDALFALEISLLESDVAIEVVNEIKSDLKASLVGTKMEKKQIARVVRDTLISSVSDLFDGAGSIDLLDKISRSKGDGKPFLILFVGINGTGKTTTLAKVAHMLQQAKYSVVIAASDTFRAGAIEQLRAHADRLNLKLVAQNYNSDPAAVARDAVLYAKSHRTDCVLIDTAGRMQTNKNLMEQIAKITKVVNPDFKIFVGDSLAGNDTVNQAREFFGNVNFDASILTKSDADARGGAALSIVKITSAPILYVGTGQEYEDLEPFDKKLFLETVFGPVDDMDATQTPSRESAPHTESERASALHKTQSADMQEPKPAPAAESPLPADPFVGISDDDIAVYSDLYDVAPPETDREAGNLAELVRTWIASGRPKPDSRETAYEKTEPESRQADPFVGISDDDIAVYSDLYDVAPPETDDDAKELAGRIRMWIKAGRPEPDEDAGQPSEGNKMKLQEDKSKEKSKKRGLLGMFKR